MLPSLGMRVVPTLLIGLIAAFAVYCFGASVHPTTLAWGILCASVALSVIDVIIWQTIKSLDDYVTRFQGPSAVLEIILQRVASRKKQTFGWFLVNFIGRAFTATVMGAITTSKIVPLDHWFIFSVAVGLSVSSFPILIQQILNYFNTSQELGAQLLKAKQDTERADELKRAADRPPPMTVSDEHTSGYTKIGTWK